MINRGPEVSKMAAKYLSRFMFVGFGRFSQYLLDSEFLSNWAKEFTECVACDFAFNGIGGWV